MPIFDHGKNISDDYDSADVSPYDDFSERFTNSIKLSSYEAPARALLNKIEVNAARKDGEALISPATLAKEYPGVVFDKPVSEGQAKVIAEIHDKRNRLQKSIEEGPSNLFYDTAFFGGSMVAQMADPIAIGAGFGASWAFAAGRGLFAGQALNKASKVGRLIESRAARKLKTLGARIDKMKAQGITPTTKMTGELATLKRRAFLSDVAEGFIGNAAIEPIVVDALDAQMIDYGPVQAISNAMLGAVGFAGIKHGAPAAYKGLRRLGGKSIDALHRISMGADAAGKKPNLDVVVEGTFDKYNATTKPYTYNKIDTNKIQNNVFYVASRTTDQADFKKGHMVIGDYLGDGWYASDKWDNANGTAGNPFAGGQGGIHAISAIEGANVKDFELPLDVQSAKAMGEVVDELGVKIKTEGKTGKQILDEIIELAEEGKINEDDLSVIPVILRDNDIDGFIHTGRKFLGKDADPSNHVFISNPEAFESVGFEIPSQDGITPSKRQRAEAFSKYDSVESNADYNPNVAEEINKINEKSTGDMTFTDSTKMYNELKEGISESADIDPSNKKLLEDLNEADKLQEAVDSLGKDFITCFTG